MSQGTGISWTDNTWNPIAGCAPVSAGCANCYAVVMTHRLGGIKATAPKYAGLTVLQPNGRRHFNGVVRCDEKALTIPLKWRKPRKVFVNSMSDLFHADVPFEFIDKVFAVMALCPQHTFQILTKRPERMAEYLAGDKGDAAEQRRPAERYVRIAGRMLAMMAAKPGYPKAHELAKEMYPAEMRVGDWDTDGSPRRWPLPNVWLGTSVENQKAADERIPHLLRCPASVRFLSCEPLLGEVDLRRWMYPPPGGVNDDGHFDASPGGIDWVIAGGESGPGSRPCNVAWIRSLVEQCRAAGVACFVKQLGAIPNFGDEMNLDCLRCGHVGPDSEFVDEDDPEAAPECPKCKATLDEDDYGCSSPDEHIRDSKGGLIEEWPADLRVREFPASGSEAARC